MYISSEVKIWNKVDVTFASTEEAPFNTKEGPYLELGKSEAKTLSKEIKSKLDAQIDWDKPDKIVLVLPKYNEEKKIVKFNGK